jgi:hypothetical protein
MRYIGIIFLAFAALVACVKKNTTNPVPVIEFQDFTNAGKSPGTKSDTAVMVIGYEDGDGDLFVNSSSDDLNIIFTPYSYKKDKNAFTADYDLLIHDTFRIVNKIKQPDDGYYTGKSIKGVIYMPLREFRISDNVKQVKFVGFMIDMKKHKSNVVTSPVYTLNF